MKKQSNIISATIFFTSAALIVVVSFLMVAAAVNAVNAGRQPNEGKVIKKSVKTFSDQHGKVHEANILTLEGKNGVRTDLSVDGSVYRTVNIGDLVAISKDGRAVHAIELEDHGASQGAAGIPKGEDRDRR